MIALLLALACSAPSGDHDHDHDHEAHEEADHHDGDVVLSNDVLRDLRWTTAVARPLAGAGEVSLLGELAPDEAAYAEVGAPTTGRVVALLAAPGDHVRAGTALAELESAEVGRARADLAAAEAEAARASATAGRKRGLEVVSARELESAEADLLVAQAEVAAAEAALRALGVSGSAGGSRLTLRAPLAGVVLDRSARIGQVVDPAHTLFRVASLDALWLWVHAFERDAVRIAEGSPAVVHLAALPDRHIDATVAAVGRQVDPVSRTVPVRIVLSNPDGSLLPGMSATATVSLDRGGEAVSVPSQAVQRCDAGWCVFVPEGPGRFESRPIGRGRDVLDQVEVISGLQPGETVVVEGAFLLRAEVFKGAGGGGHDH